MSTTVVWDEEPTTESGLGEVEITDNWTIVLDGAAKVTNQTIYQRADGGATYVLTVKVPPTATLRTTP